MMAPAHRGRFPVRHLLRDSLLLGRVPGDLLQVSILEDPRPHHPRDSITTGNMLEGPLRDSTPEVHRHSSPLTRVMDYLMGGTVTSINRGLTIRRLMVRLGDSILHGTAHTSIQLTIDLLQHSRPWILEPPRPHRPLVARPWRWKRRRSSLYHPHPTPLRSHARKLSAPSACRLDGILLPRSRMNERSWNTFGSGLPEKDPRAHPRPWPPLQVRQCRLWRGRPRYLGVWTPFHHQAVPGDRFLMDRLLLARVPWVGVHHPLPWTPA